MTLNIALHGLEPILCRSFSVFEFHPLNYADKNDIYRFGKAGSQAAQYEKDTWPYLREITEKYPEAGIHFRGVSSKSDHTLRRLLTDKDTIVYSRKKDDGATRMTTELTSGNPWFKDVVPNVQFHDPHLLFVS